MNRQGAQDDQGQDLSPIHAVIEPDFRNERAILSRPFERIKPHLLSTPSSISWKRGSGGRTVPLHFQLPSRIEFEMNPLRPPNEAGPALPR
jgi:hypothetical protein